MCCSLTKTVLITGAGSDIGIAAVIEYLKHNWVVIAICHKPNMVIDSLQKSNNRLYVHYYDFSKGDERLKYYNLLGDGSLNIDAVVLLAATRNSIPYHDVTESDLTQHLEINLFPSIFTIQIVGKKMRDNSFGRIVFGSSIGVKFGGGTDTFCYSLSKHAGEFIPAEARTWAAKNVFCNVVRIGITNTRVMDKQYLTERAKLVPVLRVAEPEEVAKTIFFLGSDNNTFITEQIIAVSGGE